MNYSFLVPAQGENCGFTAFDSFLSSGQATVFDWRLEKTLNLLETCVPYFALKHFTLKHYLRERRFSRELPYHKRLAKTLEKQKPKTIICRSMGCLFLLNYLQSHQLPQSVQRIVFTQTDINYRKTIPENLHQALKSGKVQLGNYYCPWDNALLASNFVNIRLRAGQIGWRRSEINNIFILLHQIKLT